MHYIAQPVVMSDPPLCINCAWHRYRVGAEKDFHFCVAPLNYLGQHTSLVTGKPDPIYTTCEEARKIWSACDHLGRWFQQKKDPAFDRIPVTKVAATPSITRLKKVTASDL